ncbi:MAG: ABC transporter permease [Roseimicrobium sp.]
MLHFLTSRILQGIAVIFEVLVITFFLQKVSPTSPFNSERNIPEEFRERYAAYYGYDKPWHVQLWKHCHAYLTFSPPDCIKTPGRGVGEIILQAFPVSVGVAVPALLLALALGIPLGAIAALRPNTYDDRAATFFATLGICLPSFVLGPLIALLLGLKLRWFNVAGWEDAGDWVLPALTLGFIYSGYIARLTRGGLRETLAQDFIRTARAKGASEPAVVMRHAFKVACLPVLNFMGPTAAGLLTGSFIIEGVFQIPGLGQHFVSSALHREDNLAIGIAVFYAALIVLFNIIVDLVQALLNPRITLRDDA